MFQAKEHNEFLETDPHEMEMYKLLEIKLKITIINNIQWGLKNSTWTNWEY